MVIGCEPGLGWWQLEPRMHTPPRGTRCVPCAPTGSPKAPACASFAMPATMSAPRQPATDRATRYLPHRRGDPRVRLHVRPRASYQPCRVGTGTHVQSHIQPQPHPRAQLQSHGLHSLHSVHADMVPATGRPRTAHRGRQFPGAVECPRQPQPHPRVAQAGPRHCTRSAALSPHMPTYRPVTVQRVPANYHHKAGPRTLAN